MSTGEMNRTGACAEVDDQYKALDIRNKEARTESCWEAYIGGFRSVKWA